MKNGWSRSSVAASCMCLIVGLSAVFAFQEDLSSPGGSAGLERVSDLAATTASRVDEESKIVEGRGCDRNITALLDIDLNLPICTGNQLIEGRWICDATFPWYQKPTYSLCSCPHAKGRYHCHGKDLQAYFLPTAIEKGLCRWHTVEYLKENPLPAGSKTLLFGNSYLRQLMEAVLCMFSDSIASKEVVLQEEGITRQRGKYPMVEVGQTECRGGPWEFNAQHFLYDCPDSQKNQTPNVTECYDNLMKVSFKNGAELHFIYSFESTIPYIPKQLPGVNSLQYFDVIMTNGVYANRMKAETFVMVKEKNGLDGKSPRLFWAGLNENDYENAKDLFLASKIEVFKAHIINRSQCSRRVGKILQQDAGDRHFCLPGVPDDVAISLLHFIY
uniref:Uncharacterized protein n=1 Tax=Heterosigma akashiwo TaxID=2829 RepID=A0A6V1L833_HETAK